MRGCGAAHLGLAVAVNIAKGQRSDDVARDRPVGVPALCVKALPTQQRDTRHRMQGLHSHLDAAVAARKGERHGRAAWIHSKVAKHRCRGCIRHVSEKQVAIVLNVVSLHAVVCANEENITREVRCEGAGCERSHFSVDIEKSNAAAEAPG